MLLITGGGDDDPASVAGATTTGPTAGATTPAPPTTSGQTTSTARTPPPSAPSRNQTTPPLLESSPEELRKRSSDRAAAAVKRGARSCPELTEPARVIDITAEKVGCATVRSVVFATTAKARRGFFCDIVAESFTGDPAIEYSCTRTSDAAKIAYTAVG